MSGTPSHTVAKQLADRFQGASFPRSSGFPSGELAELADCGLLAMGLPSEPTLDYLPVLKEIGRGSLPLGRIFEGHVNALLLVRTYGTHQQLADASEDVLQRGCVFGVWNTGPPESPKLMPCPDGTYRLMGTKTFASGAARLQRAIVTASLPDKGWQMCLVPLGGEEIAIDANGWTPLGMEASESFAVTFSNFALPATALIGRPGDYYADPMFRAGAMRCFAVHLGGAEALFDACCKFLRARRRDNDPFHLQRIGEMAVLLESGRQWLKQAAVWPRIDSDEDLGVHAQMMRVAIEEICTRVIQLVQLSAGAQGLAASEPLARTLRDLQMYLRQAGFDQAFQTIGRHAILHRGDA